MVAAANGRRFADVWRACRDVLGREDPKDGEIVEVLRKIAKEVGSRPAEGALERLEPGRLEKRLFSAEDAENVQGAEKSERIESAADLRSLIFGRGFKNALDTLVENFQLQNSPVARTLGLRPQSALVFGASGSGKTELVGYVAKSLPKLTFFRVDSTQIYSQYVGESE